MAIRVFIDGAVGTTGLEIAARLGQRDDIALVSIDDAARKDTGARRDAMARSDFAILCLPDDAAREAAELADGLDVRLIDASTAHRTAPGWVFGFAELSGEQRAAIRSARRVSNPGCYSTGFIALVAPLVAAGLIPADAALTCNAVSGYSGGGKSLIQRFEQDGRDIAWRGYALSLSHKHVPEMQVHAALAHPPLFTPAVIPAYRGMVVEVPLHRAADPRIAGAAAMRDVLLSHYTGSAIVTVEAGATPDELLVMRAAAPGDAMRLAVYDSADGSQIRLVAMLDNLGKGASGACVQNLNIMAGLPEATGLSL